jgi:hypothetical protein
MLLLALLLVTGSHGAKILGVFPFPSSSHMITLRVLMLELAGRGHEVTEATPFLESKILPNYTQIEVKADFAKSTGGNCKRTRAGNCTLACSEIYHFSIACDVQFILVYNVNFVKIQTFVTK